MNLAADPVRWEQELLGWAIRVVLCGLPSGVLAALSFHRPVEIAAMALGTAGLIGIMAWFCAWDVMNATPAAVEFLRSLKMAAGIKCALLPVAAVGAALMGLGVPAASWLLVVVMPDFAAGVGTMSFLQFLGGSRPLEDETGGIFLRGFGWILGATLLQGVIMAGAIAVGAVAILLARKLWQARSASAAA